MIYVIDLNMYAFRVHFIHPSNSNLVSNISQFRLCFNSIFFCFVLWLFSASWHNCHDTRTEISCILRLILSFHCRRVLGKTNFIHISRSIDIFIWHMWKWYSKKCVSFDVTQLTLALYPSASRSSLESQTHEAIAHWRGGKQLVGIVQRVSVSTYNGLVHASVCLCVCVHVCPIHMLRILSVRNLLN